MTSIKIISRRQFLGASALAGGGIVLGLYLSKDKPQLKKKDEAILKPNIYIQITESGKIVFWSAKVEMGQGIRTLATMVTAEELDAPLSNVTVKFPKPGKDFPGMTTGGSYSSAIIFNGYRKKIAIIRQMLVNAAALQWNVDASSCSTINGRVRHASSDRNVAYGDLVKLAATIDIPESAPLKDPKDFVILKKSQNHVNSNEMLTGELSYGIDTEIPNMVYASLIRTPVAGGKLVSFNSSKAELLAGYSDTVHIEGNPLCTFPEYIRDSLAVIADSTWTAMEAAKSIEVNWDLGEYQNFNTKDYMKEMENQSKKKGLTFRDDGSLKTAKAKADKVIEAYYKGPFLSHSPIEPMNAVASVKDSFCEVWAPVHDQSRLLNGIKDITGFEETNIVIHTTAIGGSFGRRLQVDYGIEAVLISMKIGKPVKVVWDRIQDMKDGVFRSPYTQKMEAAIKGGKVTAFGQSISCASVWNFREPHMLEDGLDFTVIMPAKAMPYKFPNIKMTQNLVDLPVPICWWRASYPTIHHTVQECWMDELAHEIGKDPYDFRMEFLGTQDEVLDFAWQDGWGSDKISLKRLRNVLTEVTNKSDWISSKKENQGRGLACSAYSGGNTYVAQVVDLEVNNKEVTVNRVTCVVDCGIALNPDNVKAQMEGGIIFGLSAALYGEIDFEDGKVEQSHFNDYKILTMSETPVIDVHIVPSEEKVGGVGEPGAHPIMAATCNAIFDAIGKRIRVLPINKHL